MAITQKDLETIGENVPTYQFVESEEGTTPMKQPIAKIRETAETFTMFDVIKYIASVEKNIKDKEAELEGLKTMHEKLQEEMALIETTLGVTKLETEYQVEVANQTNNDEDKDSD